MRNYGLIIKALFIAVIMGIPYQMMAGDASILFATWSAIPGLACVLLAWWAWKFESKNKEVKEWFQ